MNNNTHVCLLGTEKRKVFRYLLKDSGWAAEAAHSGWLQVRSSCFGKVDQSPFQLLIQNFRIHSFHKQNRLLILLIPEKSQNSISLSPMLNSRSGEGGMTPIDEACLHIKPRHLEVFLKYIDDEDLSIIVRTPTHGRRTTLQHCVYYAGEDAACYKMILSQIHKLEAKG
jgi:hypothetical protein